MDYNARNMAALYTSLTQLVDEKNHHVIVSCQIFVRGFVVLKFDFLH